MPPGYKSFSKLSENENCTQSAENDVVQKETKKSLLHISKRSFSTVSCIWCIHEHYVWRADSDMNYRHHKLIMKH